MNTNLLSVYQSSLVEVCRFNVVVVFLIYTVLCEKNLETN